MAAMEAIILEWDEIFADVWAHLDRKDCTIVEAHARRTDLARQDVRNIFAARDQVLLQAREVGQDQPTRVDVTCSATTSVAGR